MEAKKDRENKEKLLENKINFNSFLKKNKKNKLKKKIYIPSTEKESEKKEAIIVRITRRDLNTTACLEMLIKKDKDKTL